MAGRQRHVLDIAGVPGGDDVAARIGIVFQAVQQAGDLVDLASVRGFPVSPLMAVDRAEVAVFVGPFVPDAYAVFLQGTDVGVAAQEPQQLMDDRPEVQLLGGQYGETGRQVKTHLPAKHRAGASAGAVGFFAAVFINMAHQVEVDLHDGFSALTESVIVRDGRAGRPGAMQFQCRTLHELQLPTS